MVKGDDERQTGRCDGDVGRSRRHGAQVAASTAENLSIDRAAAAVSLLLLLLPPLLQASR